MPESYRVLLFWSVAVFTFVMACLPHGPAIPGITNDKIQHIIAFLTLTGLAILAYPSAPFTRIIAGLSGYGALIEIVQAIPALHRDSDIKDWLADTLAVLVICGLVRSGRLLSGR